MPTRYTKQNELQQLQYEIANEISRDAKPIADGVFGNNARHPDMASISNQELDQLYRDAYLRNDRQFLMQEASRDPEQFLQVTDRIGVPDPPMDMNGKPISTPQQPPGQVPSLAQPIAALTAGAPPAAPSPPVAVPPVAAPAGAGAPTILGPNGQPLPPSGAV